MMAAPLIAGNDIRKMSKETNSILTNKNIIAIDQDELGVQGFRYSDKDSLQIWCKPLRNGEWAVCFLNRGATAQNISFDWKNNVMADTAFKEMLNASSTTYKIRNVWTDKPSGTTDVPLKSVIEPHDVLVLKLGK